MIDSGFQLHPNQASSIASSVDMLYLYLVLVSTFFTVLIATAIVYLSIKYRKGSKADRTPGSSKFTWLLEVSWIVIPFALCMVMFGWGADLFFAQARPPIDSIEIHGVGKQWMWKFQHPEGNTEINDLHVPLGQSVKIKLISEDVIHSLYIPAFRVKHDVLPGSYHYVWFQPTVLGKYHLFCAEYCGSKHSGMIGVVHVLEPNEYEAWLSNRSPNIGPPAEMGARLYEKLRCGSCHEKQPDGNQPRGPSLSGLAGSQVRLESGQAVVADDNYLRESILRPSAKIVAGYSSVAMPTFAGQVGELELLQLIAYLKTLKASGEDLSRQSQPNNDSKSPRAPSDSSEGLIESPGTPREADRPAALDNSNSAGNRDQRDSSPTEETQR